MSASIATMHEYSLFFGLYSMHLIVRELTTAAHRLEEKDAEIERLQRELTDLENTSSSMSLQIIALEREKSQWEGKLQESLSDVYVFAMLLRFLTTQ